MGPESVTEGVEGGGRTKIQGFPNQSRSSANAFAEIRVAKNLWLIATLRDNGDLTLKRYK